MSSRSKTRRNQKKARREAAGAPADLAPRPPEPAHVDGEAVGVPLSPPDEDAPPPLVPAEEGEEEGEGGPRASPWGNLYALKVEFLGPFLFGQQTLTNKAVDAARAERLLPEENGSVWPAFFAREAWGQVQVLVHVISTTVRLCESNESFRGYTMGGRSGLMEDSRSLAEVVQLHSDRLTQCSLGDVEVVFKVVRIQVAHYAACSGGDGHRLTVTFKRELLDKEDLVVPLKERGNANFKEERYRAAISDYTRAIKLCPYSPVLYCNRALCYLKNGDYWNACVDSYRAMVLRPSWEKAYYRCAEAWSKLGDFPQALEVSRSGTAQCDSRTDLDRQLRDIYAGLGERAPVQVSPTAPPNSGGKPHKDRSIGGHAGSSAGPAGSGAGTARPGGGGAGVEAPRDKDKGWTESDPTPLLDERGGVMQDGGGGAKQAGGGAKQSGGGAKQAGGGAKQTWGGAKQTGGGAKQTGGGAKQAGGGAKQGGGGAKQTGERGRAEASIKKKVQEKSRPVPGGGASAEGRPQAGVGMADPVGTFEGRPVLCHKQEFMVPLARAMEPAFSAFASLATPSLLPQHPLAALRQLCGVVPLTLLDPATYTSHSEDWEQLEPRPPAPPTIKTDPAAITAPMNSAQFDEIWCPILADMDESDDIVLPTFHYLM